MLGNYNPRANVASRKCTNAHVPLSAHLPPPLFPMMRRSPSRSRSPPPRRRRSRSASPSRSRSRSRGRDRDRYNRDDDHEVRFVAGLVTRVCVHHILRSTLQLSKADAFVRCACHWLRREVAAGIRDSQHLETETWCTVITYPWVAF